MIPARCDPRQLLRRPQIYNAFMRAIGADAGMKRFVSDTLKPKSGARVLDLGCGPGRLFPHLPGTDYCGIDCDEAYVERARLLHGGRGARFHRLDPTADDCGFADGDFDLIVAIGLLHHLSDTAAARLLAWSRERLARGGRLVTLDGVIEAGQSRIARFLIGIDRGPYVRTPEGYQQLAKPYFADIEARIDRDQLRIPYSHQVMICLAS